MRSPRFADNLVATCFALLTAALMVKTTGMLQVTLELASATHRVLAHARVHQGASATEIKLPYPIR